MNIETVATLLAAKASVLQQLCELKNKFSCFECGDVTRPLFWSNDVRCGMLCDKPHAYARGDAEWVPVETMPEMQVQLCALLKQIDAKLAECFVIQHECDTVREVK